METDPPPKGPELANSSGGGAPAIDSPARLSDPERLVESYSDELFRFALARLRDPARAEDVVQETFLVALRAGHSFAGRSAEKSWLIGILKHKILDHFRRASRETSFTDMEFYADEEADRFITEGPFKGGWVHATGPLEWTGEPGAGIDSQHFWTVFQACAQKLPKNISTVFTLREVDGVESREICRQLGVSENNLWVMLHRARMALRRCLETNWFGKAP